MVCLLVSYIVVCNWVVVGVVDLMNCLMIWWILYQMVVFGVVSVYDVGIEVVWGIGEDQYLVVVFYCNIVIYILVDWVVVELVLLVVVEIIINGLVFLVIVCDEVLSFCDLLKFEFLFFGCVQFEKDFVNEVLLIGLVVDIFKFVVVVDVWCLLELVDVLLVYLVLWLFFDVYYIVVDWLVVYEDDFFDEEGFLVECLQVGKQWELQCNIVSVEFRLMELFKIVLCLVCYCELVDGVDVMDIVKC